MAPVISKLSAEQCLAEDCALGELGPIFIILRPFCADNVPDICIPCSDQRNDAQVNWTQSFIDIPDQCSPTARKRQNGKGVQVNASLGRGTCNWDLRAAIFNTNVKSIPNSQDGIRIDFGDEPGKEPQYYECALIPYDGNQPSQDVAIVLHYAMLMTENATETFGISTPRELAFSIYGERHPVNNLRASLISDRATVRRLLTVPGKPELLAAA